MDLIARNTDYAIRSLCYIARHSNNIVSVGELVEDLKMPGPFLRKILQKLGKEGILRSCKGKNGGFAPKARPENIYVDVVEKNVISELNFLSIAALLKTGKQNNYKQNKSK